MVPVVDRHFDLQEGKLQVERGKIIAELQQAQGGAPPGTTTNQPPNGQQPTTEYTVLTEKQEDELEDPAFFQYRNWLLAHYYKTDPKAYQELVIKVQAEAENNKA